MQIKNNIVLPIISAILPYDGVKVVDVKKNAIWTHGNSEASALKSFWIVGKAVFVIVESKDARTIEIINPAKIKLISLWDKGLSWAGFCSSTCFSSVSSISRLPLPWLFDSEGLEEFVISSFWKGISSILILSSSSLKT